jgi:hypothetical protein
MSTVLQLIFITPNTVDGVVKRKLTFAPKGVSKDDPSYFRASLLAGPWGKKTRLNKGTLDGIAIESDAPYVLPLRLTKTKVRGTDMMVLDGAAVSVVDPTILPATNAETGEQLIGKDGKPIFDLVGGRYEVTTYTLSSSDEDEPALAKASKAPAVSAQDVDEAFL